MLSLLLRAAVDTRLKSRASFTYALNYKRVACKIVVSVQTMTAKLIGFVVIAVMNIISLMLFMCVSTLKG